MPQGSPSWSPDGRHIAFDSFDDDSHYHIWIMDADGGNRRQVTTDPGDQNVPTWSRDGQWIYFSWDQGNGRDIWRTPLEGGRKERVTRGGSGVIGREAADGKSRVVSAEGWRSPLLAAATGWRATASGHRVRVTNSVRRRRNRHLLCALYRRRPMPRSTSWTRKPEQTGFSAHWKSTSTDRCPRFSPCRTMVEH